jgi:hypothetical protein
MKRAVGAIALAAAALAVPAWAQQAPSQVPEPHLAGVYPLGVRAGASVEVRLSGSDLEGVERLLFSHPGLAAEPVAAPPDRFYPLGRRLPAAFRVKAAADVPPGIYEVRAAGLFGISNARRFVVSDRDEVLENEPNNEPSQAQELPLGAAVQGRCDAQNYDYFRLSLSKGRRVIIEGQALRLDSRAQLVVVLLDAEGREHARAVGTRFRDPLLDFVPPADGAYELRVHDLVYRGGDEYAYRIAAGTAPWIDAMDPPALEAGRPNKVVLYGRNLPGGGPVEGVRGLERLEVTVDAPAEPGAPESETLLRPADASADFVRWQFVSEAGCSNPVRFLLLERAPVREAEPNDRPEEAMVVTLPAFVAGRFHPAGDRDGFVFEAKRGERLWIEIFSQRFGWPTDPQIVLQQVTVGEKGALRVQEIQESDDQPTPLPAMGGNMERRYRAGSEDPAVLWTVPQDGRYRILVRDLHGAGAPAESGSGYVLVVRPARPDFRLVAFPVENFRGENRVMSKSTVLRRGGAERVRVVAFRREGFDGAIRLEAEGLPPGVSARPVVLGPGNTSVDFILQAAPDAPAFAGALRLVGRAEIGGKSVAHPVRGAEVVWRADTEREPISTRVTETLGLAVDPSFAVPVSVRLGEAEGYRTSRGGKLKIPVKLVRHADSKDLAQAKIKLTPAGLPGRGNDRPIQAREVTLEAAKPEGELEIDVTEKAAPGVLSFTVTGEVDLSYTRTPERVAALQADEKRVGEVLQELAAELKKAQEERAQADKEVQKARAALEKVKASGTAEAALKEAEEKLKAAEEARARAAEAEKKAQDLIKAGEALKKELAAEIKKASDLAKEKKVKAWLAALPVDLEIVAAPIAVKASNGGASVPAGGSAEIELELERLFGFDGEVKLEAAPAGGAPVKAAGPATFAPGQARAKLALSADKAAKPGAVGALALKAQLKFNGRTIPFEDRLEVRVVEPPPPPSPAKDDRPPEAAKPADSPK